MFGVHLGHASGPQSISLIAGTGVGVTSKLLEWEGGSKISARYLSQEAILFPIFTGLLCNVGVDDAYVTPVVVLHPLNGEIENHSRIAHVLRPDTTLTLGCEQLG